MNGKVEAPYAFAPTALLTNSSSGSNDCESDERARCSVVSQIRSGVGEPTMVDPSKLSRNVLQSTVDPNSIEVLERLRDSYKVPLGQEALTGADQAVLVATVITLRRLACLASTNLSGQRQP
jgi:hypothetical protein